ncbi:MAG: MG2 domain-containing protein, partial [Verrucomicrobiales bacterium]
LTSESVEIKVFTMESSQPLANAQVEIIDANNIPLASGVTDATGGLTLSRTLTEPGKHSKASYIVVQSETKNGGGIQPYQGARFISSGWVGRSSARSGNAPVVTASAFADRSLYRPGDPVHVKGTVRLQDESRLLIPSGDVSWNVIQGYSGPTLASGDSSIDAFGGWEMTWTPPKTAKLGSYNVRYTVPPSKSSDSVHFQIEEYKPPLFVVELDDPTQQKMRIASHYFHGSPNAGAMVRWEASWSPNTSREDGSQASDQYSPNHKKTLSQLQRKGEFRLDADGVGFIDLEVPFEKPWSSGCYLAYISVEVLSPEGQVMEAAKYATITPHKVIPTIAWKRVADDEPGSKELQVDLRTEDVNGTKLTELPMSLTIYRKETQTVKERLGQNVYRYRNFPLFHTIKSEDVLSGSNYRFTPEGTGHFVAYAKLKDMPTAPAVSDSIHSVGDGEGRYDVYNDGEITLQLDKKRYVAGKDTAQIALESPFGGQAWVCVETDRIIDQFLIDLPANNRTISLPIKPSYHPNVHASVYLLRPGGPDHLPSERYGMVDIEVDRPDLELSVTPELITSEVDPGGDVSGIVRVLCQGQPVLNADVTVFAVDEAVHQLGHWEMPEWYADVYPR